MLFATQWKSVCAYIYAIHFNVQIAVYLLFRYSMTQQQLFWLGTILKPVAQRQEMVIGTLALLSSLFMVAFR